MATCAKALKKQFFSGRNERTFYGNDRLLVTKFVVALGGQPGPCKLVIRLETPSYRP